MGTIISSKLKGEGKIVFEVLLEYDEAIQLQGHMDNVIVFSENNTEISTRISTRGKNSATKYLLIPKNLRTNLRLDKGVSCQKLELKDKVLLIYAVDKY